MLATNSPFSWTPSLLSQRKTKHNKAFQPPSSELAQPEKDPTTDPKSDK